MVPVQTSVNSRLRQNVNEPFLASGIAFLVGTLFLIIFGVFTGSPFISFSELGQLPWWGFLSGIISGFSIYLVALLVPQIGNGSALESWGKLPLAY